MNGGFWLGIGMCGAGLACSLFVPTPAGPMAGLILTFYGWIIMAFAALNGR